MRPLQSAYYSKIALSLRSIDDYDQLVYSGYMDTPVPTHAATQHSHEIITLLSWDGPGRPFKKRGKSFFTTSLLLMLLVEIILFLFAQYMLMLVVISLVFLAFVLATVAPHDFHYRISSQGVQVEDHYFLWQELYDFYFKKIHGVDVLHIRTKTLYPGELTITLGHISPAHIKAILLPYLPYREYVKPTFIEKSSDWLSKTFPMEMSAKLSQKPQ